MVEFVLFSILGILPFDSFMNTLENCCRRTYYYQIQLQLLMTEASFCDFVLDSGIGDPHIERIFNDLELQSKFL